MVELVIQSCIFPIQQEKLTIKRPERAILMWLCYLSYYLS